MVFIHVLNLFFLLESLDGVDSSLNSIKIGWASKVQLEEALKKVQSPWKTTIIT
jgi:hypothetical protein